jgi:hypothetical protein
LIALGIGNAMHIEYHPNFRNLGAAAQEARWELGRIFESCRFVEYVLFC